MGSMNKATLCGNIGTEPKITTMQNTGNKCAQFTLATTEPAYTLNNGTQVHEKTEWHNIVAWGGLATITERFLQKGAQVLIEGKIRTRKYTDKNQQERYTTEIVADDIVLLRGNMKDQPQQQQQRGYQPATTPAQQPQATEAAPASAAEEKKDDLPF